MAINDCADIRWPCPLPEPTKEHLLAIARPIQGLNSLGLTSTQTDYLGVGYLTEGIFSVSLQGNHSRNVAGACIGRYNWCGANSLGTPNSAGVVHVEELFPVSLLLFPRRELFRLADLDCQVYRWLYAIGCQTSMIVGQAMANTLHDQETRVAYALIMLLSYLPHIAGAQPRIDISQQQLSVLTGISRPRLNQTLKKMEQSGELYLNRGAIFLQQPATVMQRLDLLEPMFLDPRHHWSAVDE